jgi:hypothetical protein
MNKKLEKLVELKKKEMDQLYFHKYFPLLQEAYLFLSRKKALLYGGTALNLLLPTALKFYDPYELPDIDVLSPYAKQLATDMVRHYKKNGHQAVSFTEALHEGTYKVFADGIQVTDITQCSPITYETLLQTCVRSKKWKIKIVPPLYLRMTLHKILSQPNDIHRWENFYNRLQKYYQTFPLSSSCRTKVINHKTTIPDEVFQQLYNILPKQTIFFGKKEVELVLNHFIPEFPLPPMQMLTDQNLVEIVFLLKQQLPHLTTSRIFSKDDLLLDHVFLYVQQHPVGIIYQLSSCVAYNEYKHQRIATIHTMLDLYLSMLLSRSFQPYHDFLQCLTNELSQVQQDISSSSKKKYLQQMVISCMGPSKGLATMKRERFRRLTRKS